MDTVGPPAPRLLSPARTYLVMVAGWTHAVISWRGARIRLFLGLLPGVQGAAESQMLVISLIVIKIFLKLFESE